YPVFDDVDFVRLRKYVSHHGSELVRRLGASGLEELNRAIDAAECSILAWKEREPRIWGRLAQWIYRRLDLSGLIGRVRTSLDKSEAMAMAFINAAIERWEREDRIEAERAAQLRNRLSTSEVRSHVKHLGAHLVLSLGLAIPIPGLRSAARFTWVLAFRLKARYGLARGRITRAEYKEARGMHSVPVMLISLLPAVGAAAYVASDTMRKHGLGHILADQFAYKLPFGLYRRLRLARITALPARGTTTRADKPLQKQPVRLQQWRPGLVEQPVQLRKQPCSERQKAPVRLAQLRPGLAGVPVTCREQKKHAA
ncbi:MAG: hypothetical protein ACE5JL_16760, partial [Dehalococcoidia bacterium]